jgi:hypothetical protein
MSNVNSPLSKQKFRLHPLIHFPSKKPVTKCGGWIKIAKVGIKVCEFKFAILSLGLDVTALENEATSGVRRRLILYG